MKSIEYCLDSILKQLEINYKLQERPALDSKSLMDDFDAPQGRDEFFKGLMNILIDDGYIDFLDNVNTRKYADIDFYRSRTILLPKGFYFLEDGGYTQQRQDRFTLLKNEQDRNQRMERNEVRLTNWTKNLFYGTIAAALILVTWEMIKTFLIGSCS